MKFYKFLAVALAIVVLACAFVACNETEEQTTDDAEKTNTITVSFKIKDANGKVIDDLEAKNYVYEGDEPTIYNIITDYLEIDQAYEFKDKDGTIISIGEHKATDGYYWAFKMGTADDGKFINGKMSEYKVADGDSFTVQLAKS